MLMVRLQRSHVLPFNHVQYAVHGHLQCTTCAALVPDGLQASQFLPCRGLLLKHLLCVIEGAHAKADAVTRSTLRQPPECRRGDDERLDISSRGLGSASMTMGKPAPVTSTAPSGNDLRDDVGAVTKRKPWPLQPATHAVAGITHSPRRVQECLSCVGCQALCLWT